MLSIHVYKKIAAVALILTTAACGFEPLYVQKTSEQDKWYFDGEFDNYITDQMSQIKIMVSGERLGQLIKNNLLDLLTPQGVPAKPKYYLRITLDKISEYDQALRRDITATRKRIDYRVSYYMMENGEEVLKGNAVSYVGYDILDNPYSTTISRKKVQEDAARIMANDIALRLGAFFNARANAYEDAEQKDRNTATKE